MPFLVAFGLIGLVMSVLIVVNVVSGAVSAGTRRIGVLKPVGFTPAQVMLIYVLQVAVPAVAGVVAGAVAGNLLAVPVLDRAYHQWTRKKNGKTATKILTDEQLADYAPGSATTSGSVSS